MKPTQEPWELGLTRKRLADYLGVGPGTLDTLDLPQPKLLTRRGGVGKPIPRYDRRDIDAWMDSRPRRDGSVPAANDPGDDPDGWGDPDME
jgi:hypothetical protein